MRMRILDVNLTENLRRGDGNIYAFGLWNEWRSGRRMPEILKASCREIVEEKRRRLRNCYYLDQNKIVFRNIEVRAFVHERIQIAISCER